MIKRDNMVAVQSSDPVRAVLAAMKEKDASHAVVLTENGVPEGLVYAEELSASGSENGETRLDVPVSDVMRRDFKSINAKMQLHDFLKEDINSVLFPIIVVNDDGTFSDSISKEDLIQIMYRNLQYTQVILDNIDEGIVAVDENNNIAYMNEPWKKIHSVTDDELIGTSVSDTFPESGLASGELDDGDEPLHLKSTGATVIPSYRPLLDTSNQPLGSMAIVRDYSKVNDFYIGVNQISKLNRMLDSAFDHLAEAVFYVDKKGNVLYANNSSSQLIAVKTGEKLKEGVLWDMLSEKFDGLKVDSFREEVEYGSTEGEKYFDAVGIPIIDASQKVEGIVVILQDITSIKKLNDELERNGNLLDFYEKKITKVPDDMICESPSFKSVVSKALRAAETDVTVLIEGENGVGKEMIANMIHKNSDRRDRPFIPVNCGAIPESLWESEMFGYEEGAFTGAKKGGKAGIFEIADGGTVFLDEVGEMSMATQVKMLRFLQNMEIAKVGRKELKKVNVRIIAATNKDIDEMVKKETFRMDLYYRLNVICLTVPPLRERREEIAPLAQKFISTFNDRYNRNTVISDGALTALKREFWPGNIRQLSNVIEQAVIMSDSVINEQDLQLESNRDRLKKGQKVFSEEERYNIPYQVAAIEKQMIEDALIKCNNNKSKAIEILHISRKTFYKKLKDYDIMK